MSKNKFPLYVVSKGRWDSRLTVKALDKMNADYHVVVEPEEFGQYAQVIDKSRLLVLPQKYHDEYDPCDDLGFSKSQGPGAARNFAWEHSMSNGHEWHWVMDDNIRDFYYLNQNKRIRIYDTIFWKLMEDFCLRYENVLMAGPAYRFFAPSKQKRPPFVLNTRIYSCNLIRNDAPYRWRGRYNEDTDLSLRMLKDGYCTVQFNAFLQDKVGTQVVQGGNTKDFYAKEGTMPKSEMQVRLHPDVSRLVYKWGRWHHHVDYSPFKNNHLIKKKDAHIGETPKLALVREDEI